MKFIVALVISALSGFIALSYEILWFRVYSILTEGPPDAFGFFLGSYLAGIAMGSYFARWFCERDRGAADSGASQLRIVGIFLFAANVLGFYVVPLVAHAAVSWQNPYDHTLPVFAVVAALLGTSLPLISHFAISPDEQVGSRLSYLYLANIIGSAAGSLTTGFIFFDLFSLRTLCEFLFLLGVCVAGALILAGSRSRLSRLGVAAAVAVSAVFVFASSPGAFHHVYEKLHFVDDYDPKDPFAHIFEGKSGVIAVSSSGTVFGGGTYDGRINVDPTPGRDINRIMRAYATAAFHESPRRILMIGLGSGSWLQVLANHPDVERIVTIEINPGYVEIMRHYGEISSVIDNPKSKIVFDDGRRYLQHSDEKFDLIVQNTIVFWRGHSTNVLSREYLELSKQHLAPGGIIYYNSTTSAASQRTGAEVFPYAMRFQNMIIGSETPIEINYERWRDKMLEWTIDGVPVVAPENALLLPGLIRKSRWRGIPAWETRDQILARTAENLVITDDNMASEWRDKTHYP